MSSVILEAHDLTKEYRHTVALDHIDLYFTTAAKKQLMKCFKHKVISLSDTDFETIQRISDNFKENASNNLKKILKPSANSFIFFLSLHRLWD